MTGCIYVCGGDATEAKSDEGREEDGNQSIKSGKTMPITMT